MTLKYHTLLIERTRKENLETAKFIRKILYQMLKDEKWLKTLKTKQKPEGILTERRTINLTKELFEKLKILSDQYNIPKSYIITKSIEDYFQKQ